MLPENVGALFLLVLHSPTSKAKFMSSLITNWLLKLSYQNGCSKQLVYINLNAESSKFAFGLNGNVCVHSKDIANRFPNLKQGLRIIILYWELV